MPEPVSFLGVTVRLTGKAELLRAIECGERVRVATLNPEFMLEARTNPAFRQALADMTHCTVDGTGLYWYLKRFHPALQAELYHGADLVEELFHLYREGHKSFFFLGGKKGVAAAAASAVKRRFPELQVAGTDPGGFIDPSRPVESSLVERINALGPAIVLVGFGAPKQELWLSQAPLSAQVGIGVGGTFGFYTSKRRAPRVLRQLHLEWLWRTLTEKGHFKRAFRATILFPVWALWFRARQPKAPVQ